MDCFPAKLNRMLKLSPWVNLGLSWHCGGHRAVLQGAQEERLCIWPHHFCAWPAPRGPLESCLVDHWGDYSSCSLTMSGKKENPWEWNWDAVTAQLRDKRENLHKSPHFITYKSWKTFAFTCNREP